MVDAGTIIPASSRVSLRDQYIALVGRLILLLKPEQDWQADAMTSTTLHSMIESLFFLEEEVLRQWELDPDQVRGRLPIPSLGLVDSTYRKLLRRKIEQIELVLTLLEGVKNMSQGNNPPVASAFEVHQAFTSFRTLESLNKDDPLVRAGFEVKEVKQWSSDDVAKLQQALTEAIAKASAPPPPSPAPAADPPKVNPRLVDQVRAAQDLLRAAQPDNRVNLKSSDAALARYSDDDLRAYLAQLEAELGRIPAKAERSQVNRYVRLLTELRELNDEHALVRTEVACNDLATWSRDDLAELLTELQQAIDHEKAAPAPLAPVAGGVGGGFSQRFGDSPVRNFVIGAVLLALLVIGGLVIKDMVSSAGTSGDDQILELLQKDSKRMDRLESSGR